MIQQQREGTRLDISEYLDVKGYAALVGKPYQTVYSRVCAGTLPSIKVGAHLFIHRDAQSTHRPSQRSEKRLEVERLLREWSEVGGGIQYGVFAVIADQVGLTRERVRQIANAVGAASTSTGAFLSSPVYLACATCGVRPVSQWRRGGVQCLECKLVPIMCDYCGYVSYITETQFMNNYRKGENANSGTVQCNRAGKKRCPRGPASFVLQLGGEWEKVWVAGIKYISALRRWARAHNIRIATEHREDGYWMRRVG